MIGSSPRPSPSADFFEFGPFRMEIATRSLYRGDEFVPVTPKALDTLFVLVEEAGRLVTKDELMQKVWPDAFVEDGSIANNISMLRKLLNPFFEGEGPIATVARRGYRFTEPVRLRNATAQISLATDSGTGRLAEDARTAVAIADAVLAARKNANSADVPPAVWTDSRPVAPEPVTTPSVTLNITSNATPNVLMAAALILIAATVAVTLFLRPAASPALTASTQGDAARASLSSNTEALRLYLLGLDALRVHDMPQATEQLQKAVHADPGFALAHSALSISWRVLGHDDKSRAAAKTALGLSTKLGREDQLAVEGAYFEVMADWLQAAEKYQALWSFFPDNPAYGLKLVHQQLIGGRMQEARRTLDQMRALPSPNDTDPRFDLVEADWFFREGRFADAATVAAKGIDHAKQRESVQLEARLLLVQGRAEFRQGDTAIARQHFMKAQQLFEKLGDQAGVADVLRADGLALASRGDFVEGKRCLDRALRMATSINHQRLIPDILAARAELEEKMAHVDADR